MQQPFSTWIPKLVKQFFQMLVVYIRMQGELVSPHGPNSRRCRGLPLEVAEGDGSGPCWSGILGRGKPGRGSNLKGLNKRSDLLNYCLSCSGSSIHPGNGRFGFTLISDSSNLGLFPESTILHRVFKCRLSGWCNTIHSISYREWPLLPMVVSSIIIWGGTN